MSGRYIDMEILGRIVRENNKKRYSFWMSHNGVWQSDDIAWKYVKKVIG